MNSEFIIQFLRHSQKEYVIQLNDKIVGKFISPIHKEDLKRLQSDINSASTRKEQIQVNTCLNKFGTMLYKSLFNDNPELERRYQELDPYSNIILKFDEQCIELLILPWEYISEPNHVIKRIAALYPLIRQIGKPRLFCQIKDRPVKIMIAIAEPLEECLFNGRFCHDRLLELLKPMLHEGLIDLSFLSLPATPDKFASQLIEHQYDIVHFIGHGSSLGLCFEGEKGENRIIKPDQLYTLFANKSINLIILTACQTAAFSNDYFLSGSATALIAAGIPAIVAMQFSAQAEPAFRFIDDLYRSLISERKQTLANAVKESRANRFFAAQTFDAYQWGVPVLYLQALDANIFQYSSKRTPAILNDWPALPTHNIIYEDKPLIGRASQMIELNKHLRNNRIVVLLGEGGIGKTALANNIALWHLNHSSYPGGIILVNLEISKNLDTIIDDISAILFGSNFRASRIDKSSYLKKYFEANHCLLIFDNFENAKNESDILQFVKNFSYSLSLLIVCRESIDIGYAMRIKELNINSAIKLFSLRAQAAGWDGHGNEQEIKECCEALGNLPLAIELV